MKIKSTLLLLLLANSVFAQKVCNEFYHQKFTQKQLEQDVDFIKEKIVNAHVNPFTEISKEEFEKKYTDIRKSMKDGMTQKDFYYLAKPLIVTLNDEHSSLSDYCVTDSIKNNMKVLPLKFKYDSVKMILTENYSDNQLNIGDELTYLNNIPINEVLKTCAQTIPGDKDERVSMAVDKFWIMINKFCYFIKDNYDLKFKSGNQTVVKSISLEQLRKNASNTPQKKQEKFKPIDYKKIKDAGYLAVNTFNDRQTYPIEEWKKKFDSIFTQIRKDNVKKIVIDVHNNSGGNSAIGNLLISYFSDKSYNTYQGRWKKSQEYVDYLKKENESVPDYEKLKNGDYYPMKSHSVKASKIPLKFNGKTYVIVGKNTFSSAMMFGAIVLDNKLAEVVGEIPEKGHPNHFGELIEFQTPNTKLDFRFGVKEWIRPAGNITPNKLIPTKIIDLNDKTEEQIIEQL
ncbi:Peptidase family S41 [Chryseobacterium ureilyticum]|uniref:Peptidase family S41 n=1 Tax=Chryseobacterium ureilyticum TaxID=373668 RepID=A0A1N7QK44_9FLAO|nr:S41 family peptidase [Chryseobacterium ureilyticum]SIT22877.1 Peptidase family S41 [Chryseobacterium ureilyticum]